MKKKELKQLRTKSLQELQKLLAKKQTEAMKVRINVKVAKEKNLKHVKMLRREISQVKTVIRKKQLVKQIEKESKEKP